MKILIMFLVAVCAFAADPVVRQPNATVVASLGSAATQTRLIKIVTDGADASDCSAGGGSTRVVCYSTGAAWVNLSGGGGSAAGCGFGLVENGGDCDVNTAVIPSLAILQSGVPLFCDGTGTAGAQTCTMSPALTAYTDGMAIVYKPEDTNTTTQTVAIDGLAAKSILTAAAGALTAGDLTADRYYVLTYDGTQFRLPQSGGGAAPSTLTGPYNLIGGFSLGGSELSTAANRVIYAVFYIEGNPRSFNRYRFWCQTAPCGNQGFAVYDSSYNLISGTSGSVDSVSNGGITGITLSGTVTLQPGRYYLAWTTSVATAILYGTPNAYYGNLNAGESSPDFGFFYGSNASTGSADPFTFPATIGTQTAISSSSAAPWFAVH